MSHPVFARHETFHPRYGWLKKGVELIHEDSVAFSDIDVHMRLGVGKNMASAIRYWCEAFSLIEPHSEKGYRLTPTAQELIVGTETLDPYLESTATLWWLHYLLLKTQKATTWNFAIDHFGRTSFTAEELERDLGNYVRAKFPDHKVADSSLNKDVSLFLRMYSFDDKESIQEDSLDSPFIELGLINKYEGKYKFVIGSKPTLPNAIITAACLDFAATENASARSISLTQLVQSDLSPVKAFRLTEANLYEALQRVVERRRDLFISDTAGVKQLSYEKDPQKLAHKILKEYYKHALS